MRPRRSRVLPGFPGLAVGFHYRVELRLPVGLAGLAALARGAGRLLQGLPASGGLLLRAARADGAALAGLPAGGAGVCLSELLESLGEPHESDTAPFPGSVQPEAGEERRERARSEEHT